VRSRSALATGLTLAQIGEFSFVLAKAAQGTLLDDDLFKLMVSVTIVSLVLTPYLVLLASRLAIRRAAVGGTGASGEAAADVGDDRPLVIVVGFGPAGQTVTRSLVKRGTRVIVIDLNPHIAQLAEADGAEGHHGDASHAEILEHAGVSRAVAVVVTVPDPRLAIMVIQQTRALGPQARILARARYSIWCDRIREEGAETVIDEESGMGRRLAASTGQLLKSMERANASWAGMAPTPEDRREPSR
jgi:CPA2 family monovalent cation:H+ antiporter-2